MFKNLSPADSVVNL